MRRLRRWLFNGFAALSLLLCVGTAVLWVQAHIKVRDSVAWMWLAPKRLQSGTWCASASFGELNAWREKTQWADHGSYDQRNPSFDGEGWEFDGRDFTYATADRPRLWERAGFVFYNQTGDYAECQMHTTGLMLPLWFVVLGTSVVPVFWTVAWLHRRRIAWRLMHGHCLSCGYNLAGNVSGVCPECGKTVTGKLAAEIAN